MEDFEEFKRFSFNNIDDLKNNKSERENKQQNEIILLKEELANKEKIIKMLHEDLDSLKKQLDTKQQTPNSKNNFRKTSGKSHITNSIQNNPIPTQNRFSPLQTIPPNSHRISNQATPLHRTVPGNSSYANIVSKGSKVLIYGDSIVKPIRRREMSSFANNCNVFIKPFPGVKSKALLHHVEPTLIEESPDIAIIHVGTNDVRTSTSAEDIAKIIINIGRKCVSKGVNKVFISLLLQRSSFHDTRKVRLVNDFLREFCTKEGFFLYL